MEPNGAGADEDPVPVVAFKKRKKKSGAGGKAVRKRSEETGEDDGEDGGGVELSSSDARRGGGAGKKKLNSFQTAKGGSAAKRLRREQEQEDNDDRDADDVDKDADGGNPIMAKMYKSSRSGMAEEAGGGAFSTNDMDTANDRDARAILERSIVLTAQAEEAEAGGKKVYKGQAGYKTYKTNTQVANNKYSGTQGPIRAPTFVRTTAVFDYQPDVCKDYKETGYCGFGDSCKFLHDRGDYKGGWQLEKEWEEKQKKKQERELLGKFGEASDDEDYTIRDDDDDDLPTACFICRDGFTDPIVTNCGHYFCERCALDHHQQSPHCAACGKNTGGTFTVAKKLVAEMSKKGLVKKQEEGGQNDDDDDDGDGSDYEIKDEVNLTASGVSRVKRGGWATVTDTAEAEGGGSKATADGSK